MAHTAFQGQGLFAGQNRFTLTEVVIRHSENSLVIRHIADDTGHIAIPGKLAGHLAAVARDDLIAAASRGRTSAGWLTPPLRTLSTRDFIPHRHGHRKDDP